MTRRQWDDVFTIPFGAFDAAAREVWASMQSMSDRMGTVAPMATLKP